MLSTDIPTRFPIPFANNAAAGYTRNIPEASQITVQAGAASLTDGFPPVCFLPVGAGGTPPWGQDFNGLLNQISAWSQWQAAAGPVPYDATFATSIGGYPKGAILAATTFGQFWLCTAEDNATDPDAAGANWVGFNYTDYYAVDSGAANVVTVSFTPAPANLAAITGKLLRVKIAHATTISNPTLTVNGFAALPIINSNGSQISPLAAGSMALFISDGVSAQLVSNPGQTGPTFTRLTTAGSGTYNTPAGVRQLRIRMMAGGAGGGGAANSGSGGAGGVGGTSAFNDWSVIGGSGGGGNIGAAPGIGGIGGTGGANGTGTLINRVNGGSGSSGTGQVSSNPTVSGSGGNGPFGGGGGGIAAGAAKPGAPNTGGGASGGTVNNGSQGSGAGGGCGEFVEFLITAPAASYAWTVGAGGVAGTGSSPGAIGGTGVILIEEIY